MEENGKRWAKVARFLGNRTDNQVMRRWNYLVGGKGKKTNADGIRENEHKIVKKKVVGKKKSLKSIKQDVKL